MTYELCIPVDNPAKRGRPPQTLAQRLANKTTAIDPTNFNDPEHWFPVLRAMHSFGRSTTTARALYEAYLGRKLEPPHIEQLEHSCRGFRIVDGRVSHCCNPAHQILVRFGLPASADQQASQKGQTQVEVEPEVFVMPEVAEQSDEEEIADIMDSLDTTGPAWRLDYDAMFTKHVGLYDEYLVREALKRYGVKEPGAQLKAN